MNKLSIATAGAALIASTVIGFGLGAQKAAAVTTTPIDLKYILSGNFVPIPGSNKVVAHITGNETSTPNPFGLDTVIGTTYIYFDPVTGIGDNNSNPEYFGLQNQPPGMTVYSSRNNSNKLFGTQHFMETPTGITSAGLLKALGTGLVTITGGEGELTGATGSLDVLFDETIDLANSSFYSTIEEKGYIQVPETRIQVPEPGTITPLVGMGIIGAGMLLRQRRRSGTSC